MSAHLRIAVGDEHYALPIAHVREVLVAEEPVPVPGAGAHVLGVRNLRGEILPVVRLDRLLDTGAHAAAQVVVVEDGPRRAGLAVSAAAGVERLPAADRSAGGEGVHVTGTVLHDGALVGVLDVPALLDAVAAEARP